MSDEPNNYEQKKKFHAMVRDISRQVPFCGEMLDEHEWKLLILAAAYGQDVAPNPLGPGFVIRNRRRTRDLAKSGEGGMADLITQLYAFGADKGVEWTDPEWRAMREADAQEAKRWAA